jgi:glutathione S-transferase
LYSNVASQWANVPHLGLAEKGYSKDDYDIKEIDLRINSFVSQSWHLLMNTVTAENFDPDYLKINPNGTVPSLTSPSFSRPLVDSTEILTYLDDARPSGPKLSPTDAETKKIVENLIGLVHSDDVGTNLILLQSRNKDELEAKRASPFKDFVGKRQEKLEEYKSKLPDHPFYGPKAQENGALNNLYVTDIGPDHPVFFEHTNDMYRKFAAGMDRLEPLIVLPYAAGDNVTLADLHMVPWLAHAMWGAGTTDILDFGPLERLIQKTVPDFKVGPKTRAWWENMSKRDSFKQVFPHLH